MLGSRLIQANHIARRLWGIYFPKTDWRHHLKKQGVYAVCVGSYRKVRRPCSCWMCGNPRRHFGVRTRQEIKAALKMNEPPDKGNGGQCPLQDAATHRLESLCHY